MKKLLSRLPAAVLLLLNLATLFLDWQVIDGLTTRKGVQILTRNVLLSCAVLTLFFVSIILFDKAKRTFFTIGLCSLSMLAALEFSAFEAYGRFGNPAVGVYLGVISIALAIAVYVLTLKKQTFPN